MPSFDLVDEGWIPCVLADGTPQELGLRDTLLRAHEIRAIADQSPLITLALHRLLLAVLHRAFDGPQDLDAWIDLWSAGRWDEEQTSGYLEKCRQRLDLFHPERPFYQVPFMADGGGQLPVAVLAQELAAGNNATLFDHHFNAAPGPMAPSEAARNLVALQAFAIGGGVSKPFNFMGGPLTAGLTMLMSGKTLFQTLALNLLAYNEAEPIPRRLNDLPAWEQDHPPVPDRSGTAPRGYLDLLTWQSRRIHLIAENDPLGVRYCQRQQNLKLGEGALDPFKCYRRDDKLGWLPLVLRPERALWRDSNVLFQHAVQAQSTSPTVRPPLQFSLLAQIDGQVTMDPAYTLAAFGLATEPGKAGSVLLWRHESLPLPLRYLDDAELVEVLQKALQAADDMAGVLRSATEILARKLLPQGAKPGDLLFTLAPARRYWWRLEAPFSRFMIELINEAQAGDEDDLELESRALRQWLAQARSAAEDAFRDITRSLDTSARSLRAASIAERSFGKLLHFTLDKYESKEEQHAPPISA